MTQTTPEITTQAVLTCPQCGSAHKLEMPVDACQFFFVCPACDARLRPQPGDCCVFCSYADTRCPSQQIEQRDAT